MSFRAEKDGPGRTKINFDYMKPKRGPIMSVLIPTVQIFLIFCFMRMVMLKSGMFVFVNIPVLDDFLKVVIAKMIELVEMAQFT